MFYHSRPSLGDRVLVKSSQRIGVIVQDDRDSQPYRVKYAVGDLSGYLAEDDVEKVSCGAIGGSSRPSIGDHVRIKATQEVGEIVRDDKDSVPFLVSFRNGGQSGFLPEEAVEKVPFAGRVRRATVQRRMKTLYHATSLSNAQSIQQQKHFRPGRGGFLGPGIYFSESENAALAYCQCRTGVGGRVVLRCEVNVGNVKMVGTGYRPDAKDLLEFDSFEETTRDCIMLPNDDKEQVDYESLIIV